MSIAEELFEKDQLPNDFDLNDEVELGHFLGTTWCARKFEDGSIIAIEACPVDCFTGGPYLCGAFDNFSQFEDWVKKQDYLDPDAYKVLA